MYQCVAGNKHGEVYSNAELQVIGKTLYSVCVWVCVHTHACIQYVCVCMTWAQAYICLHLFSSLPHFLPLFNTGGWPPAFLLLATNWKALIIRWMRLADSDVCQSCSIHQPHPSALSKPVTLHSGLAAALIHYSTSNTSHPDHVAGQSQGLRQRQSDSRTPFWKVHICFLVVSGQGKLLC